MKKILRLVLLCLIPGLALVLLHLMLAGPLHSGGRVGPLAGPGGVGWGAGQAQAASVTLQVQPISGLSITHSAPAFAFVATRFTATVSGGTSPIFYAWAFGDGASLPLDDVASVAHTYTAPGVYTVVITALNLAGNVSQSASLTVAVPPHQLYLPAIWKDFTTPIEPADLLCSLSLDPPAPVAGETVIITVQLQNQLGNADGFWVDLYINPTTVPTAGQLISWQNACGGPASCTDGIAWSISNAPLAAGFTRTLVSIPSTFHPGGFDPGHSHWSGSFPAGTHNLYAYADSIDNPALPDTDGAVFETNEHNNRCEVLGLLVPPAAAAVADPDHPSRLPARPSP